MYVEDLAAEANTKIAAWLLGDFRRLVREKTGYMFPANRPTETEAHLATCPDAEATHLDGGDGRCGEGTCDELFLDAAVHCPHGYAEEHLYSGWGALAELLKNA